MSHFPQSVPNFVGRIPLWIAITVTALLWMGQGSSTACASCGDYLHHAAAGAGMESGSTLIASPFSDDAPPDADPPVKPCSGPECRRGDNAPAQPIPVENRQFPGERLALPPGSQDLNAGSSPHRRAGKPLVALEDHRAGLDRPPRSA